MIDALISPAIPMIAALAQNQMKNTPPPDGGPALYHTDEPPSIIAIDLRAESKQPPNDQDQRPLTGKETNE